MSVTSRGGRLIGRPSIGAVADQALYSLQNFGLTLFALHILGLHDVGRFSLIYGAYAVAIGTFRALALEVLLTRQDLLAPERRRETVRATAGAAALSGVVLLVVASAVSLVVPEAGRAMIVCSAVGLIPILVQDSLRYGWLATPGTWCAAANDLICLTATTVLAVLLCVSLGPSVALVLSAWAGGAAVAASCALVTARALPSLRQGARWLRTHRRVGLPLAGTNFATQLGARASMALIGSIAGLEALGRFSAATAIMAPVNVVLMAAGSFGIAEASRQHHAGRANLRRYAFLTSGGLALGALAVLGLYEITPAGVGRAYLGDNWSAAGACVVPMALLTAATALGQGPKCGFRALGLNRTILVLGSVYALVQLVAATVGAITGGVVAAAWAMALAGLVCGTVSFAVLLRRTTPTRESARTPVQIAAVRAASRTGVRGIPSATVVPTPRGHARPRSPSTGSARRT